MRLALHAVGAAALLLGASCDRGSLGGAANTAGRDAGNDLASPLDASTATDLAGPQAEMHPPPFPPDAAPIPPPPDATDITDSPPLPRPVDASEDEFKDPGPPPLSFGPLCSGTLETRPQGEKFMWVATAIAVDHDGNSQLFLRDDFDAPGITKVYVSLVVPGAPWTARSYVTAIAGKIEVTTTDRRTYRLNPATSPGSFKLQIERVVPATTGDHYYLKGSFVATVPSTSKPGEFLTINVGIN